MKKVSSGWWSCGQPQRRSFRNHIGGDDLQHLGASIVLLVRHTEWNDERRSWAVGGEGNLVGVDGQLAGVDDAEDRPGVRVPGDHGAGRGEFFPRRSRPR